MRRIFSAIKRMRPCEPMPPVPSARFWPCADNLPKADFGRSSGPVQQPTRV